MLRLQFLVIALVACTCAFSQDESAFVRQMAGKPFPEFNLKGHSGRPWTQSDMKGKVTLVSFWFIGCKNCMQEVPCLNILQDSITDRRFQLLSFARNTPKEIELFVSRRYDTTVRAFKAYRSARQMKYEIIPSCAATISDNPDCELLHRRLHVNSYPVTMLVDKTGIIRRVYIGFPDPKTSTKDGILNDPGIREHFYMLKHEVEALLNN